MSYYSKLFLWILFFAAVALGTAVSVQTVIWVNQCNNLPLDCSFNYSIATCECVIPISPFQPKM